MKKTEWWIDMADNRKKELEIGLWGQKNLGQHGQIKWYFCMLPDFQ